MINQRFLLLFVILAFFTGIIPVTAGIKIEEIKTPHGFKAWFVKDKTTPVISLSFAFKVGSVADPLDKEGVADLTAVMLMEGAGSLDKRTFTGKLQDFAIGIGYSVSLDTFAGHLTTLKENQQEAVRLLNLTLTQPRFEPEALTRIKNQRLIHLATIAQDPSYLANVKTMETVYADHPYSRSNIGTIDTIPAIKESDLRNYVQDYLGQDNLIIGITGNLTAQEACALIDQAFKDLPPQSKNVTVPDIQVPDLGQTFFIDQDIPQSTILFAQQGLLLEDPALLQAVVLMHILGTGDTSRLNEEIREKRGLAYYAGAGIMPLKHAGLIIGNLGTSNFNVGECLTLIRNEWKRVRDKGVTLQELENAKSYLIGAFPLYFTESSNISTYLVQLQYEGKELNYLNKRTTLIKNVTLKELNTMAKEVLKPDSLLFTVVGKPQALKEEGKKPSNKPVK